MDADSPLENGVGTQALSSLNSLKDAVVEQNSTLSGHLEGIHQRVEHLSDIKDNTESIALSVGERGWFYDILTDLVNSTSVAGEHNEESRNLQDSMADSLSNISIFNKEEHIVNSKESKKQSKLKSAKFDDLKDLPYQYGTLGAILINELTKKDDKKKESKGIQGFFKGLLEGVTGIAALGVALLVFAGATLLFNFVDWGKAVIGMIAFTVFTIGMIALTKLMKNSMGDFVKFAMASLALSAALGVFAISLLIASNLIATKPTKIGPITIDVINIPNALAAIGLFMVFELGVLALAKLLSRSGGLKSFVNFAVGSILMSAALAAFSLSLVIVSRIFEGRPIKLGSLTIPEMKLEYATQGLLVFGAFMTGVTILASIVGAAGGDMKNFALGSILMAVALVTFSISLVITSKLFSGGWPEIGLPGVDRNGAIAGLVTFGVFMAAMTGLAIAVASQKGNMLQFAVASAVMSFSLLLFAAAMYIVGAVVSNQNINMFGTSLPGIGSLVTIIAGVGLFLGFVAAFTGLAYLANSQIANIALFAATSLLMSISLMSFAVAMAMAGIVITGGTMELGGMGKFDIPPGGLAIPALAALVEMAGFAAAYAALGLGMTFVWPFVAIMAGVSIPMAASIISFSKAMALAGIVMKGGQMEFEGQSYNLEPYDPKTSELLFDSMSKFLKLFSGVASELKITGAIALAIVGKAVIPIIDAINKMIDVVLKASKSKDEILSIVSGESNALDHLMDPVMWMIIGRKEDGTGGLMYVAKQMDVRGAAAFALVSRSILPLVEAMDKMIDVVLKAATMKADGFSSMAEMVSTANINLNLIMTGTNNDGFLSMFVMTAEQTKHTSSKAAEAMTAMPALVEALSGLVDIVKKAAETPLEDIQNGVLGLGHISTFLVKFMETVNDIIPGGVKGAIGKIFGGDPLKKLEQAHELLQPGGSYYNIMNDLMNIASKFSGDGFKNLSAIAVVGTFTTEVVTGSENFKKIMDNISKGFNTKMNVPAGFDTLASAMERMAQVNLSNIDSLQKFTSGYRDIERTADAMDRLVSSLNRVNSQSMVDKLSSAVDKAGSFFGFESSTAEQTGTNSGMNSGSITITPGNELEGIAAILSKWDENGVKVYGLPTATRNEAIKVLNV